jgi:hypothetical protein
MKKGHFKYKIMIKNSTVIIGACLILIGIISYGVIDNVFERKNMEDKNKVDLEIEKLKVNESLLNLEPRVLKTTDSEIIYIPGVSFKNGYMDIEYCFYRYENEILIKIPIHN